MEFTVIGSRIEVESETLAVRTVLLKTHVLIVFVGVILSFTPGYIFENNTNTINHY
ncbi:MAG: hypothetical protein QMC40_11545 [Vicingaceae bacterium]